MLIRIVRSTMAAPLGQPVRAVDVGEVLDVAPMVARQLIAIGKAMAVGGLPMPGGMQTPEEALTEIEIRPEAPKRSKRR